jgi:cobalt-zinc-cadmium efflux system protein
VRLSRLYRQVMRGHEGHDHGHRTASTRALVVVLVLTTSFTVVEVVGGLLAGSLALLADAGHMLTDNLSIALALGAVWLSRRPPSARRSFGYRRAEILAAFLNGLTLALVSIWIVVEALRRLPDPPPVSGGWVLAVAAAGLAVNVTAAAILLRAGRDTLNVEAAYRHVVADGLGSVGVIVAALVVILTGWEAADPLVSLGIAGLILWSAWGVLRDSTAILMEGAPSGIDVDQLQASIAGVPGVVNVHDLHVWTISSGFDALSAHVLVAEGDDCHRLRREIERMLATRFGIGHTTLQVDHAVGELLTVAPAAQGRSARNRRRSAGR